MIIRQSLHYSNVVSFIFTHLKLSILLFVFVSWSFDSRSSTKSKEKAAAHEELIQKKVDFILKVAKNIQLDVNENSENLVIAVYGRNADTKSLYNTLKRSTAGRTINNKPIEVKIIKRMMSAKEARNLHRND